MTYKQIEASREVRLWITGIIGPVLLSAATVVASDPEMIGQLKTFVVKKKNEFVTKLRGKKEA